jgi:hypothetical protein
MNATQQRAEDRRWKIAARRGDWKRANIATKKVFLVAAETKISFSFIYHYVNEMPNNHLFRH